MKIIIHQHMMMNQQSLSVRPKPAFLNYLKSVTAECEIHLHLPNVYLFFMPTSGEQQQLNLEQKKFIYKEEFSLFEEQYGFKSIFTEETFNRFFNIEWHGVIYHMDVSSLDN